VKRSRSGTPQPADQPRTSTIVLLIALAIVLAFAGSLIFGLRGPHEPPPVAETPESATPPNVVVRDTRAKVEVLNGSGKTGLAKLATEQLRDAGFDVVQFGNGPVTQKSYVLDRVGKLDLATTVGHALSITDVRTKIDTTRYVDASVVLGRDWPKPKE
jgi:hypothetical protein